MLASALDCVSAWKINPIVSARAAQPLSLVKATIDFLGVLIEFRENYVEFQEGALTDPLTLGVIGGLVAQEGVKFLYGQLTALIDRARKKNDTPIEAKLPPDLFANAPPQLVISPTNVVGHEQALDRLAKEIAPFVQSPDEISGMPGPSILAAIGDLRALIESLSGQRLDFIGEPARRSPIIEISAVIGEIEGRFIGFEFGGGVDVPDIKSRFEMTRIGSDANVTLFKRS